jgi:hypothetical protein
MVVVLYCIVSYDLLPGFFLNHPSRWLQISAATLLTGILYGFATWSTTFWPMLVSFGLFGFTQSYGNTGKV